MCLPASLFQASQLIVNYDEHEVNNTFKFGVIYQRFGQVGRDFFEEDWCFSKHISLLKLNDHYKAQLHKVSRCVAGIVW